VTVPSWYAIALLSLAAYRTFRLLGEDTVLDRPRHWLVRLPADYQYGDAIPESYRQGLALWLQCPWCAGFWNAAAWFAAWQIWPHGTLVAAALFALSTIVGTAGKLLGES
jgi:Protein of unknown function (DUF1360)